MTTLRKKSSMRDMVSAPVTEEDLKTAINAIDSLPEDDRRDFTGRMLAIMRAFDVLGEPGSKTNLSDRDRENIARVTAVQIRIESLAALVKHPRFKQWSMAENEKEGSILIREDVLKAAAEIPLLEKDGRSYFDPDQFFDHLLAVAEEQGHG